MYIYSMRREKRRRIKWEQRRKRKKARNIREVWWQAGEQACARFTLAIANGNILRRKRERGSDFLGMKKTRERERERTARKKAQAKKTRGRTRIGEKSSGTLHTPALPLLLVAPGARDRYSDRGSRREDIRRSAGR